MNKVLIIGRFVRNPEIRQTESNIKYARFTLAVQRPFAENQADFIPVIAWRNQADFIDKYMEKGSLVSIEGRFTSNTYQNAQNQTIWKYEVSVDRINSLETKAQKEARMKNDYKINGINEMPSSNSTQKQMHQEKNTSLEEEKEEEEVNKDNKDVPWEIDL